MEHPLKQLLATYRLVLASNSPRRREILGKLDLPFEVRVAEEVDESYPHSTSQEMADISLYLARKKNKALSPKTPTQELIITADTTVIHQGKHLEKPKNSEEACQMLDTLQGGTHDVYTGLVVSCNDQLQPKIYERNIMSKVFMNPMSRQEIAYYVHHYQPMDKAGAYGVQEWFGAAAIGRIEGCHYNVMGLPISDLMLIFREIQKDLAK
ncbi:MAG: septum formation protein Maf [Cytophagales bacterium]|nr:MAG: septum formation protein Maf [Cytophagales bacterium]TAF62275.1 MAG: septum formation protein Maf [Cytophagales bacterium]